MSTVDKSDSIETLIEENKRLKNVITTFIGHISDQSADIPLSMVALDASYDVEEFDVFKRAHPRMATDEPTSHDHLHVVSSTATTLATASLEDDLFDLLATSVIKLVPGAVILVNRYDRERNLLVTESFEGMEGLASMLIDILGGNPVGSEFPLPEIGREALQSGRLTLFREGIHVVSGGVVPVILGKLIERVLGIREIYGIGLVQDGELFGNVAMVVLKRCPPVPLTVVETLVHLFPVTMRRLRAEHRLRESEQQYRMLAEHATDVIWTMSLDGKITYLSPSYTRLLGSPWDGQPLGLERILTRASLSKAMSMLSDELRKLNDGIIDLESSVTLELEHKRHDGGTVWMETTARLLPDEHAQPSAIIGLSRDISDRRRMEDEVRKAQRLESLGVLAGGIAHDFNNILTAILGNVALARRNIEPDSKALKQLEKAESACFRAKDLTHQLLTFSKGGAPVRRTASLVELIHESCELPLRGSSTKCTYDLPKSLWNVKVDEGQMSQVFHNIVLNAIQAMPTGGRLNIEAHNCAPDEATKLPLEVRNVIAISITDSGPGISPDILSKIFDPYFTTKAKGTGLGLATCYSIVKRHGGALTVESTPGKGSTFSIYLPATTSNVIEQLKAKTIDHRGHGSVVVMDDEPDIRALLGAMLQDLGYQPILVSDGEALLEAHEIARQEGDPIRAFIMDLTIPGGQGGKETVAKLLEIDPGAKAIVSSGYSNDPVLAAYDEHGFVGVVAKPYRIEDLSRVLAEVLSPEADPGE